MRGYPFLWRMFFPEEHMGEEQQEAWARLAVEQFLTMHGVAKRTEGSKCKARVAE